MVPQGKLAFFRERNLTMILLLIHPVVYNLVHAHRSESSSILSSISLDSAVSLTALSSAISSLDVSTSTNLHAPMTIHFTTTSISRTVASHSIRAHNTSAASSKTEISSGGIAFGSGLSFAIGFVGIAAFVIFAMIVRKLVGMFRRHVLHKRKVKQAMRNGAGEEGDDGSTSANEIDDSATVVQQPEPTDSSSYYDPSPLIRVHEATAYYDLRKATLSIIINGDCAPSTSFGSVSTSRNTTNTFPDSSQEQNHRATSSS
ncbi:hypothetical protein BJ742DRAFT_357425 [Cladochytrium replicatum]|nr:hypothetical protein BJ742DRAFT_357425 [Cladochytrium replicatum]